MADRRLSLGSLKAVRLEMQRVYRNGRDGALDTRDMSRLIYALGKIADLLQAERQLEDFATRLAALEADYGHSGH